MSACRPEQPLVEYREVKACSARLTPYRFRRGQLKAIESAQLELARELTRTADQVPLNFNDLELIPVCQKICDKAVEDCYYASFATFVRQTSAHLGVTNHVGNTNSRFGHSRSDRGRVLLRDIELHDGRGVEIENQPRSSSMIWAMVFSPRRNRIGGRPPWIGPPLPGRTQGKALIRAIASASLSSDVGFKGVTRATGRPRSVMTTSVPACTSFKYFDRWFFISPS